MKGKRFFPSGANVNARRRPTAFTEIKEDPQRKQLFLSPLISRLLVKPPLAPATAHAFHGAIGIIVIHPDFSFAATATILTKIHIFAVC